MEAPALVGLIPALELATASLYEIEIWKWLASLDSN
jgi:hypothetical protein